MRRNQKDNDQRRYPDIAFQQSRSLLHVRALAEPCFLCGWVFDGGPWDTLFRFSLLWLSALKLDVTLVAKLMVGSAPVDIDF